MIGERKAIKDLENTYAVMYKGMIYRIQDISSEGALQRLKLISLTLKEIVVVLWNKESMIICSPLLIKRCLIIKHVNNEIFQIESLDDTNNTIELSKENAAQAYRWMIEYKSVYVILYFCFDEMHVGSVYTLPK